MTLPSTGPRRIFTRAFALILGIARVAGFPAASLVIRTSAQTGAGTRSQGSNLTYWTQTNSTSTTIPGTVPGLAGTTASSPSVLPRSAQSYALNAPTAGHNAVEWVFTETSSAPTNTEIEVTATVATGTRPTSTTFTVFFETQSSVPGSSLAFTLYFDSGVGGLVFDSSQTVSQQCTSVGTCP